MSLSDKALPLFDEVLKEVRSLATSFEFSTTDRQQLVAASLLATTLEHAEGINVALNRGNGTSAYILLRSLLEAFVDLQNLVDDPDYFDFMQAAVLDQQKRILESAIERGSTSPFLADLQTSSTAPGHLVRVRSELSRLKKAGVKPLSVKSRFDRAGLLDYYEGPYAHLCWHSHNNLNMLEQRHLRMSNLGAELRISGWMEDDDLRIVVDTAAGIAASSVASLNDLLGTSEKALEEISTRLETLRSGIR